MTTHIRTNYHALYLIAKLQGDVKGSRRLSSTWRRRDLRKTTLVKHIRLVSVVHKKLYDVYNSFNLSNGCVNFTFRVHVIFQKHLTHRKKYSHPSKVISDLLYK